MANICIVTGEFGGPDYNGGIGSANRGLALALREAGHHVDVLYTRVSDSAPFCFRGSFQDQVAIYQELGIRLMCIRNAGPWDDWKAKSRQAMEHLIGHPYDLVFFDETHGNAYFPLLAKRTGNAALADTRMCVVTHGATQWVLDINGYAPHSIAEIQQLEMERRTVELADLVIAPSRYIVEKYKSYGWRLADKVKIQPNILASIDAPSSPARHVQVDEIVFFGRLETRKGLWTFCRALDRLQGELRGRVVTFLGKPVHEHGQLTSKRLTRWTARWPFEVRIISSYDSEQAQRYLMSGNRVAIMPSPEDNSPSVVAECLAASIPFLASSVGGGADLIHRDSHPSCLVDPTVPAIVKALRRVVSEGIDTARPAFDRKANRESYMQLVGEIAQPAEAGAAARRRRKSSAQHQLVLLVPGGIEPERVAAEIADCQKSTEDAVSVIALAEHAPAINKHLKAGGLPPLVKPLDGLKKLAASPEPGILHFAKLGIRPSAEWFERSARTLSERSSYSALTGIAAAEREPELAARAEHVSVPKTYLEPVRDVGGALGALYAMSVDTNGGLLAIKHQVFAELPLPPLWDRDHAQVVSIEVWIHRTVVALHDAGHVFDLVPDIGVTPVDLGARASMHFELGGFARERNRRTVNREGPGTERDLAMRLGFESFQESPRRSVGERIIRRAGAAGEDFGWNPGEARPAQIERLMRFAHAVGKVDLSIELATELVERENSILTERRRQGDSVRSHLAGLVAAIDLYAETARGRCRMFNLNHEWSFQLHSDSSTIQLHANPINEGRATLVFPDIDLTTVEQFVSEIELPSQDAQPVRFRFEVSALDGDGRASAEAVLRSGERGDFSHPIPVSVRMRCRVELSAEMANAEDVSANAFANWIRPVLLGAGKETS